MSTSALASDKNVDALKRYVDGEREAAEAVFGAESLGRLSALGAVFGLSRAERGLLLLCAAPELGVDLTGLGTPTFGLARALFPSWLAEHAAPQAPLRYWQLVEVSQPGATPLVYSSLRADERTISYLQGVAGIDQRLALLLSDEPHNAEGALSPSQARVCAALAAGVAAHGARRCVVELAGERAMARLYAGALAGHAGRALWRVGAQGLAQHPAELETFARLWLRECLLAPLVLLIELDDLEAGGPEELAAARLIERYGQLGPSAQLVLVGTRDLRPTLWADLVAEARRPTPAEQQAAWREALRGLAGSSRGWRQRAELPTRLARQFNLDLATIRRVSALAAGAGDRLELALWDGSRAQARARLSALAQRIEPRARLEDLKLPERECGQLQAIREQVEQRGRVYDRWGFGERLSRGLGISALFAGPSGTGKTMAAEALAAALRLDLYRIDLAGVVSKYIGETEKNLRRLFDAAEAGGAILFFDEAEALFGKRSEVRDSHDRYANIEVGYLLMRIEQYCGLSILATNMRSALDPAFTRRLRFSIDFPFPATDEREQIWQTIWPRKLLERADPLDYRLLGGLGLSGGSILNVAQSAAFRVAARPGGRLGMGVILDAVRDEQLKEGRRDDLRPPPAVQRRRERWQRRGAELFDAAAVARIDTGRLAWFPASDAEIDAALAYVVAHRTSAPLTRQLIAALARVRADAAALSGGAL